MTDVVENSDSVDTPPRQPRFISTIFKCYRENFVLFWRIMMPVIIFSFLFDFGSSFSASFFDPEELWHFDTARGLFVNEDPESVGVDSGMIFGFHAFSISWLWLTMCPLILAIVKRHRGEKVTARNVWRRTGSEARPILAASCLLYVVGIFAMLGFILLTVKVIRNIPDSPYASSLCLGLFLLVDVIIYFSVNWSLYNQSIIIENQRSTTASLRRSSELVRGVWGRTFGMYLLLAFGTMALTSTILSLTLLLFSLTVPEFAPLREVLLSVKSLTFFFGGYARISFESAPNVWAVGIMALLNTLINAVVAPVWAILTTHLYIERTRNCLHGSRSEPAGSDLIEDRSRDQM